SGARCRACHPGPDARSSTLATCDTIDACGLPCGSRTTSRPFSSSRRSPVNIPSSTSRSYSILRQRRVLISRSTGDAMAPDYVSGDKVYCVYVAPSEEMVRKHAQEGGFPANKISEIKSIIDPTTAEKR